METTVKGLFDYLMTVKNTPFGYVEMETPVLMNKVMVNKLPTNPFLDRVTKITKGNFYLGSEYQNRVNNNLKKEGKPMDFVSQKPSGKSHVEGSNLLLVDDKTGTKFYLHMEWFEEMKPISVEYVIDGNDPIEKELFQSYMVKKSSPTNQGLERTVNVITPKLSNIRVLHVNGMKFEIRKEVEVEIGVEV